MFKVLSAETRVKIIELLKSKGPLGAKGIAEKVGITASAVSQHLKVLKKEKVGFVRNDRLGYQIPYSINPEAFSRENCCVVLNEVCKCGCKVAKEKISGSTAGNGSTVGKGNDLKKENLESLKQHEKELEKELEQVRKKISELNNSECGSTAGK